MSIFQYDFHISVAEKQALQAKIATAQGRKSLVENYLAARGQGIDPRWTDEVYQMALAKQRFHIASGGSLFLTPVKHNLTVQGRQHLFGQCSKLSYAFGHYLRRVLQGSFSQVTELGASIGNLYIGREFFEKYDFPLRRLEIVALRGTQSMLDTEDPEEVLAVRDKIPGEHMRYVLEAGKNVLKGYPFEGSFPCEWEVEVLNGIGYIVYPYTVGIVREIGSLKFMSHPWLSRAQYSPVFGEGMMCLTMKGEFRTKYDPTWEVLKEGQTWEYSMSGLYLRHRPGKPVNEALMRAERGSWRSDNLLKKIKDREVINLGKDSSREHIYVTMQRVEIPFRMVKGKESQQETDVMVYRVSVGDRILLHSKKKYIQQEASLDGPGDVIIRDLHYGQQRLYVEIMRKYDTSLPEFKQAAGIKQDEWGIVDMISTIPLVRMRQQFFRGECISLAAIEAISAVVFPVSEDLMIKLLAHHQVIHEDFVESILGGCDPEGRLRQWFKKTYALRNRDFVHRSLLMDINEDVKKV